MKPRTRLSPAEVPIIIRKCRRTENAVRSRSTIMEAPKFATPFRTHNDPTEPANCGLGNQVFSSGSLIRLGKSGAIL